MFFVSTGEGSYGSVYKALHKESGQVLAIKQVPVESDLGSFSFVPLFNYLFLKIFYPQKWILFKVKHKKFSNAIKEIF